MILFFIPTLALVFNLTYYLNDLTVINDYILSLNYSFFLFGDAKLYACDDVINFIEHTSISV